MVKSFIYSLFAIFFIFLLIIPLSNESLYLPLAPPFNDAQVFYYTRGSGTFSYMYDKNRGVMKGVCSATKNIGSLLDEADLTLTFKGSIIASFNGTIERLFVKYTLKGKLYVKSICLPNTFSASAEIGVYVDFLNSRIVLASKTISLYYSGEDQYVFNDVSNLVSQDLNLRVYRGEKIDFTVTMHISSVATGALEDYSYSSADFSSGDYGLRITMYIGYLEDSYIYGSITPSKAYVGDSVEISGYLVDSRMCGIPNSNLLLYLDSDLVASIYTDNNGYFHFQYIVPTTIVPGEKTFKVVFEGDSNHLPSSQEFKLTIPSFTLHASYSALKIPLGSVRGVDVYVDDIYDYDLPVEIKIYNLPSWLSYGIVGNTSSIPPFNFHIYFTAYDVGECDVEILAIGYDNQTKKVILNIESYIQPTYLISVNPYLNEVIQGSSVTYNVTLTPLNGYNGIVTLYLEANGLNCSSQFSLNPVSLYSYEKQLTLILQTFTSTNEGFYDLVVKGVDGNGLTVYSNTFKLHVKRRPYFEISVYPTYSSIFSGEDASFYVNLTSFNGFDDFISLEISSEMNTLDIFRYNFSENPVYLSPSNFTKIVKLCISSSENVYGIFNFTINAYSTSHNDTCKFSLEIKQSASIELYYVNWINNSWHRENTFMPYEAVGIIVRYTPFEKLNVMLPKPIFGEFNSSSINISTDESGLSKFIVFINGLQCPLGSYKIYLLDTSNKVVGSSQIRVDGIRALYRVYNDYNYSRIFFYLKWCCSNESVRFRGGNIEIVLDSSINIPKHSLINDSGVAILDLPHTAFNDSLIFHVYYAYSPFKVKFTNSSFLSIVIPYKCIFYDFRIFSFNNFNLNLNIKFYYSNGDSAILKLLLIVYNDTSIAELNYTTDDNGFVTINFSFSPFKNIMFKLLCRDTSDRWISRVYEPFNLCWDENIGVLAYVDVKNEYATFTFIPTSRFMNFNCTFYVMFFDESDSLFYSCTTFIHLRHGSITHFPIHLLKKVHRIFFAVFVNDYEIFEGSWVNGDFSWKTS